MATLTNQTSIAVARERAWHEWMMVAVGITGLLSIMAIIVSVMALSSGNAASASTAPAGASPAAPAATVVAPKPEAVKLVVKTDVEHGKRGPDGTWHDAFQGGDFSAKAGQTVKVTVLNYDNAPHSFNAPTLGVNVTIPGGSTKVPHKATFTFKAPSTAGSYQWFCALPCDPWAMAHDGYMRGHVTVLA